MSAPAVRAFPISISGSTQPSKTVQLACQGRLAGVPLTPALDVGASQVSTHNLSRQCRDLTGDGIKQLTSRSAVHLIKSRSPFLHSTYGQNRCIFGGSLLGRGSSGSGAGFEGLRIRFASSRASAGEGADSLQGSTLSEVFSDPAGFVSHSGESRQEGTGARAPSPALGLSAPTGPAGYGNGTSWAQPEPGEEVAPGNGVQNKQITAEPSCPVPDFSTTATKVTLLRPIDLLPEPGGRAKVTGLRPLLVYVPGMDGSGQVIRSQIPSLYAAGYDIRCVYIPSSDRSSWQALVDSLIPLLRHEVGAAPAGSGGPRGARSLTLLAESFGACLALRIARAAPALVSRLVLANPATGFASNSPLASICARTGILAAFPTPIYELAQDILLPLLVKRNRVLSSDGIEPLSPVDYVPAPCASWRLAMLNDDSGLLDYQLAQIKAPTLILAAAKDRVLPSLQEGARLQRLLPNARRVVLPQSGHTVFLEEGFDVAALMERHNFKPPPPLPPVQPATGPAKLPGAAWAAPGGALQGAKASPAARAGGSHEEWGRRQEAVEDDVMDEMGRITEPWRVLTSPLVSGEENLPNPNAEPRRPVLFVGNHTLFGLYDSPLLVYELFMRGFRCRGLAHPGHWLTGFGQIMERYGNVKATPIAAYRLLKEGENVLLFPGGAREVNKRKGEEYELQWKKKADFVRMASRLNTIIVPFALLGADDAYKILLDSDDILSSPIGPLVRQMYEVNGLDPRDLVMPLTALPGSTIPSLLPIPTIERVYIHFGEALDTAKYNCDINDPAQCQNMYSLVRTRVEDSIAYLKNVRQNDPERELPIRLLRKVTRLLPEFSPRTSNS